MNTPTTDRSANHPSRHSPRAGPARVACLLLVTALVTSALPVWASPNGAGGRRALDTMTVNLYIGTEPARILLLDPADPNFLQNLVATVTGLYVELLGSQPPVRLQGVADRIAARMPDVVAVEEATLLRVQSPGDIVTGGTTSATDVVFDYLQILVNALNARGAHYRVASSSQEWDIELPMLHLDAGGNPVVIGAQPDGSPIFLIDDVRQTDREAILVRSDLPPGQLTVSNPQHGHFIAALEFPEVGLSLTRGWCSVDVFTRSQNFRYICTHLEEETAEPIQVLQAQELLNGPASTTLPVVLVGDFNSDPLGRDGAHASVYDTITTAGFSDTWAVLNSADPAGGLTWGHDPYLADPGVTFNRRIDFVFYRGPGFVPTNAEVIDMALGRSEAPLWASDHAALAAELQIDRAPFAKAGAK